MQKNTLTRKVGKMTKYHVTVEKEQTFESKKIYLPYFSTDYTFDEASAREVFEDLKKKFKKKCYRVALIIQTISFKTER